MEKIAVWADGTQAYLSELEEYLTFMSDDFLVTTEEEIKEAELAYYQMKNEDAANDNSITF